MLGALVGAATIAGGLIARAAGVQLGATWPPFYVHLSPSLTWYLVPAVSALAVGVVVGPRLMRPAVGAGWFAGASLVLTLAMRLALNAAREGPAGWYRMFGDSPGAPYEYLPALPALRLGVLGFLDRFAEFSASLPIHPSGHPPGMVLTLHLLDITTAPGNAALTIGVGALAAPFTYALARQLLDETRARLATLLYVFAPSSLLYGAASADSLFAAVGVACAAALVARRRIIAASGCVLLWLATFFSYALTGVAAWAVLVVARLRGLRTAAGAAAGCTVVLVAGYALLYAFSGFDLIGSLEAANSAYVRGISQLRPYAYWLVGSPTAFFVSLGIPLAWLVLRGAGRGETTALALLAVIVVAVLMGFTKAENERIWQFLVPLACVSAAAELRSRSAYALLAALAAQALVVQVVLDTGW